MRRRRSPRRYSLKPRRGPTRDKPQKLPRNIPSQSTIQTIIATQPDLGTEIALRNRLIIELAYGSGLRRCEIVSLDIQDLDLAGGTAMVTGKNRKSRVVPLTASTITLLSRLLLLRHSSRGPLIISTQSHRRLSINHVSKLFKQLTGLNTHRFRHACATHLLQNGCSLRYIQELLGHAELSTTQIYTHLEKGKLAEIVAVSHPRAKNN